MARPVSGAGFDPAGRRAVARGLLRAARAPGGPARCRHRIGRARLRGTRPA